MSSSVVPNDWQAASLESGVDILDSQRVPLNSKERQARIQNKSPDQLYPYFGATGEVGKIDDYLFDEELVALGEDGVPFLDPRKPKAYILSGKTWVNNHAHVLRAKKDITTNRFLLHYLNQFDYQDYVNGGTRLKLTQANMRRMQFPLPPLAEQKVIADKLDTLLAQVENTKARLVRIPKILKRFRQSVLAAAVSGRLTEEWRDYAVNQDFEPFEIPASWTATSIGEVAEVKGGKRLPKGDELVSENTGYPYIRAGQLKNGTVISGQEGRNAQLFITENVRKVISRYTVNTGDAYITIVGASIGDAGIIPKSHHGANLTENAAKITNFKVSLEPRYLSAWLRSEHLQDLIRVETKSAAQGKLALSRIKTLPLPLPPIKEQTKIVHRVDQLFIQADRVEQQVNNALARVNNLTQAILAKAFRGELTNQWRNDNLDLISGEHSAEALPEKIKIERAAITPVKKPPKQPA